MGHRILFVCTGNVFRSVGAAFFVNQLAHQTHVQAGSAGIHIKPDRIYPDGWDDAFNEYEMPSRRTPVALSRELLTTAEMVIAMASDHKSHIKVHYGVDAVLYNWLCRGVETDVVDATDDMDRETRTQHMSTTFNTFRRSTPNIIDAVRTTLR